MKLPLPHFVLLAAMLSLCPVFAEESPADPESQATTYNGSPPHFLTDSFTLRLGESAMIPVTLSDDAPTLVSSDLTIQGDACIEVMRHAEIIAGQKLGFCRIRSLKPGTTTLRSGDATIKVTVENKTPMALVERMRPQFTSPVNSSAIWGTIAIGAEVWIGAPGSDRDTPPQAVLVLPSGEKLEPVEAFPPLDGPFWRFVFELDTTKLSPGEQQLLVQCPPPITAAKLEKTLVSEPLNIIVIAPEDAKPLIAGECEAFLETTRSERLGTEPPGVGFDASASGSRFVSLFGSRPYFVIDTDAPEKARYQLVMRSRGTLAGSAYPTLEIATTDEAKRQTNGRLVSTTWRRCAIGRPFTLEQGKNIVGITLGNDFRYRNVIDRNAEIDTFELVKVPATGGGDADSMMASMMADESMAMMAAKPAGKKTGAKGSPAKAQGLRCAFSSLIHGEPLKGEGTIHATVFARNFRSDKEYAGIKTSLIINGKRKSTASGKSPQFHVMPHDFKPGENHLQLIAFDGQGTVAQSMEQSIVANGASMPKQTLPIGHDHDNYDLYRSGWKSIQRSDLKRESPMASEGAPRAVHQLGAKGKAARAVSLYIPEHITGELRIATQLRAWQDPPAEPKKPSSDKITNKDTTPTAQPTSTPLPIEIILEHPGEKNPVIKRVSLGIVHAGEDWNWHLIASAEMKKGRKILTLKPRPDLAPKDATPAPAALGTIRLDTPKFLDQSPPEITLTYPSQNSKISSQGDAIVARVFDDTRIDFFTIHIDGEAEPLSHPNPGNFGKVVLPLDTTALKPGKHRIQVVATDKSGKTTASDEVNVEVTHPVADDKLVLPYPRAVRLATQFGYGPDHRSITRILETGEIAWLEEQLNSPQNDHRAQLERTHASTLFPDTDTNQVRGKVIAHCTTTHSPARLRFVLWAQNHFNTWIAKTGSEQKLDEHRAFEAAGAARFSDLLLISATSPAMITYLDQQNSLGRQLNENYAREIMELHTVGVQAGYSQEDVTNLAHVLTGWGAQREGSQTGGDVTYQFRFSPYLAETQEREVFGLRIAESTDNDNADDRIIQVLEMLAARPQTAEFVSRKLVEHYISSPAPDTLVEKVTNTYMTTGGDMAQLLLTIAKDDQLMRADLEPKILQPVEFGMVAQRSVNTSHPWSVIGLGDRSGRNLFDRSTPDGYPEENEEYSDSNYQLQKWSFCKELEGHFSISLYWNWFDTKRLADEDHRNRIIRATALNRTGRALTQGSTEALHTILQQDIEDQNQRRYLFGTFFMMLPEMQIR